jgi:segregation and condensation protein B
MQNSSLKNIVEALVFASDVPISENKIAALIEDTTPGAVKKTIDELNAEFSKENRSFFITRIGGGFQVNTRKDMSPWIKKLFKGKTRPRLSQAGLESLAIIAFKQPISRVEVDAIRGVHSGGVLKNLLERNLIAISGRGSGAGKPLLYGTTKEFLQYLGVNDVSDLPKPKEIEEIMGKLDASVESTEHILEALTTDEEEEAEESKESAEMQPGPAEGSRSDEDNTPEAEQPGESDNNGEIKQVSG